MAAETLAWRQKSRMIGRDARLAAEWPNDRPRRSPGGKESGRTIGRHACVSASTAAFRRARLLTAKERCRRPASAPFCRPVREYTIKQLVSASGYPERSIRQYIVEGMLPRPPYRGKDTVYSDEHLTRLGAIQQGSPRAEVDASPRAASRVVQGEVARRDRVPFVTGVPLAPPATAPPPEPPPVAVAPAPASELLAFQRTTLASSSARAGDDPSREGRSAGDRDAVGGGDPGEVRGLTQSKIPYSFNLR